MRTLFESTETLTLHSEVKPHLQEYETQVYEVIEKLSASPENLSVEVEEDTDEITLAATLAIEVGSKRQASALATDCSAEVVDTLTATESALIVYFEPLTLPR